jgi:tetratricopeptide (TPR) repeat protein
MRYVVILFLFITSIFANAQEAKTKSDTLPYELRKQAFIYTAARQYNDPAIARMALYNLLALNPNSAPILDTLAKIYYEYQQYASAALVAQDAMQLNPNDLYAVEIAASAFDNLGVKVRAIANFEKLYLAKNDLTILYKVAFLQFESKKYGESLNNINTILSASTSDKLKLFFPTNNGRGQEVSLKAAATRLQAMLEQDKGNVDRAKELFKKALEMVPDFEIVKNQLAEIK